VSEQWVHRQKKGRCGASPLYTETAIATVATLQALFHLAGRQTEGFVESLFKIVGFLGKNHLVFEFLSSSRISRIFICINDSWGVSVIGLKRLLEKPCRSMSILLSCQEEIQRSGSMAWFP
jgi:hypothetical protein